MPQTTTSRDDARDAGAILRELVTTLRVFRLAGQRSGQRTAWSTASGVLQYLEHHDARLSELAREVSASASVTSRAVDDLEHDGHVERQVDDSDGRACVVSLTPRGRAHLQQTQREIAAEFADVLHDWSPQEIRDALEVLQKLNIRLADFTARLHDGPRKDLTR
ncbi:MAG: MarR family transcriptional regulator [Brachybacterium sp.]|nr:MarR family transcriptional regulator [Brachybacterium sp.]MDN5901015.1 MarR family transcriptional regulator [Brachybacterium sp.]